MYEVGDTARLSYDVKDPAGTLVNATGITLTITLPDDTTTSPAVTNPPAQTGKYFVDYVIAQAGRHVLVWTTTNPVTAYTDVLNAATTAGGIVGLTETKDHLNLSQALSTDDEELRRHIGAATRVVEWKCGAVVRRNVTEVLPGGCELVLGQRPVISLTSLTPIITGGVTVQVSDLDLDPQTGIVRRKDGSWISGMQRVVYRAGRAIVPDNLILAAFVIIEHLWSTQRGGRGTNVDQEETVYLQLFGFAVPRRALELLESDFQAGIS